MTFGNGDARRSTLGGVCRKTAQPSQHGNVDHVRRLDLHTSQWSCHPRKVNRLPRGCGELSDGGDDSAVWPRKASRIRQMISRPVAFSSEHETFLG